MEIKYMEDQVVVEGLKDFEPKHIFECGQCFRWNLEEDGSYTGLAFQKVINVRKENHRIIFSNTCKEDFDQIWMDYFDLKRNYGKIKADLSRDDSVMRKAVEFGYGMRILQQEPWETLISFIISSNNSIHRIRKSVEALSQNYGEYMGQYKGRTYYSFPSPQAISSLSEEDLTACGVGYRGKYILGTAKKIVDENICLDQLKGLNTEEAYRALLGFPGVGPKVANCILLFGLGKTESLPVDVWVKRVMEYFYFHKNTPNKRIEEFGREKFGQYAGYAQQYLFYYARELGIGK